MSPVGQKRSAQHGKCAGDGVVVTVVVAFDKAQCPGSHSGILAVFVQTSPWGQKRSAQQGSATGDGGVGGGDGGSAVVVVFDKMQCPGSQIGILEVFVQASPRGQKKSAMHGKLMGEGDTVVETLDGMQCPGSHIGILEFFVQISPYGQKRLAMHGKPIGEGGFGDIDVVVTVHSQEFAGQ
jgi:hypothetical protein